MIWLVVVVALAGVVGGVWATGGFDNGARPYMGPEVAVGEEVRTRFWDFTVHGAVVDRERGSVDVEMDVTSKLEASTLSLTGGTILIRLADGEVMYRNHCSLTDRSSFSPFIRTNAVCRFEFAGNEIPEPPAGDVPMTIILLDQVMGSDILESDRPEASVAAAHVELVATELPEEDL